MSRWVLSSVPANDMVLLGAKATSGTMIEMFGSRMAAMVELEAW